jgi:hypothetical protein
MTRKVFFACAKCGSDNITRDTTAYWDPLEQVWKINDDIDDICICQECGTEDDLRILDVDTHEVLDVPPYGPPNAYLPKAEADALWEALAEEGRRLKIERAAMDLAAQNAAALASYQYTN